MKVLTTMSDKLFKPMVALGTGKVILDPAGSEEGKNVIWSPTPDSRPLHLDFISTPT